jgi:hypothetical protein
VLPTIRRAALGALLAFAVAARAAPPAAPMVWLRATDAAGRPFDLERLRGQVVIVTAATRATQDESREMGARLQSVVVRGQVAVVTVVNLDAVPFFALGYARRRLAQEAVRSSMVLINDEHGNLCRALALQGCDILIIDPRGQLKRRYRGKDQLDQALRAVDELRRQMAITSPASGG